MNCEEEFKLFGKNEDKKASEGKKAAEEKKNESSELTEEEQNKVSGGFRNVPRVADYDYDDGVKSKI